MNNDKTVPLSEVQKMLLYIGDLVGVDNQPNKNFEWWKTFAKKFDIEIPGTYTHVRCARCGKLISVEDAIKIRDMDIEGHVEIVFWCENCLNDFYKSFEKECLADIKPTMSENERIEIAKELFAKYTKDNESDNEDLLRPTETTMNAQERNQ